MTDEGANHARRRLLVMAALAPVMVAGDACASTELPADLAESIRAYDEATMRHDTTVLAEIVADDYLLVNSDSTLQDKQSYLSDFTMPGFRLETYEIEQTLSRVWGDAAVTGGILELGWRQDGAQHRRRLRIAHVWAKRDGRWRITYTQLTRVPEPT